MSYNHADPKRMEDARDNAEAAASASGVKCAQKTSLHGRPGGCKRQRRSGYKRRAKYSAASFSPLLQRKKVTKNKKMPRCQPNPFDEFVKSQRKMLVILMSIWLCWRLEVEWKLIPRGGVDNPYWLPHMMDAIFVRFSWLLLIPIMLILTALIILVVMLCTFALLCFEDPQ